MSAINHLLSPRSVAIVGASTDSNKIAGKPVLFLKKHGFKGAIYPVNPRYENIGGLKMKAPVKSAGVLVGRVDEIHFDNNKFQAVVTLALDIRYQFPKDTTASILTSGLLGEVFIGFDAGGDEKNLAANDTIKLTQSAVVLERLIGQFMFGKASEGEQKK